MVTLSDVRERIKSDLVLVGSTYDAQIDDAIRSALRALRTRKFWFLEWTVGLSLLSNTFTLALPADFSAPNTFEIIVNGARVSHGNGFDFISYEELKEKYWTREPIPSGTPVAIAIYNGYMYFSHTADTKYTIKLAYYRKDATLPSASDTSIWFDDGYDVVRSLALFIFKRDSQQYTASEEDGSIAEMYMRGLERQHERYTVVG